MTSCVHAYLQAGTASSDAARHKMAPLFALNPKVSVTNTVVHDAADMFVQATRSRSDSESQKRLIWPPSMAVFLEGRSLFGRTTYLCQGRACQQSGRTHELPSQTFNILPARTDEGRTVITRFGRLEVNRMRCMHPAGRYTEGAAYGML